MALRIWLPLINNTYNQGVGSEEVTTMGSGITWTAGKIGSAATFPNSCASCLHMPGLKLQILSWTCWFKCSGEGSGTSQRLLSEGRDTGSVGTNIWLSKAGTALSWSAHKVSGSATITLNTWYHVALVCDGTKVHLYLNGVEQGTGTAYTEDSDYAQSNDKFVIGKMAYSYTSTGSYFPFNGQVNDVRIYDNALSAAEVREISQGLVLHYKLDSGYNESTTNLCGTSAGGWNNSGTCTRTVNDTAILGKPTTSNTYSVRATSDGSMALTCGTTTANHPSKTIIASVYVWLDGTQDSSSFYLRSTKTDGSVGNLMYNGNANPSTWPRQQWIRINTNAINTASDATTFYICTYVNKNTEVRAVNGWQIEEKDHVTPYTASGTTRTDIVVQDNSGYNYNGTIIGDPYIVTNSARYENAMYFTGRPCAINSVSAFSHLNTFTYSCWFKRNTNEGAFLIMGYQYGNNSSGSLSIVSDKPGFHYYAHANGNGDTQVGITQTCNDNQWHHLAATYDGTKVISYFDGVKTTEQNVTLLTTTRTFSINYTNTGSSNRDYQGALSDVRVYCTTLDADAILQLYHTGTKIDNKQNLHSFEFIEASQQKITKSGQVIGQNLLETYIPLYDKNIYTEPDGSTWIHIFHHNNPAASKFNETTLDWTTGKYLDADRWYDVDQAIYDTPDQYEFMVKQKTTNTAAEVKYRWSQTVNPLTATWDDVKPGTVTFSTSSGYTSSSYGGLYLFKTSNLHMCIANSSNGNWYGGIGAATAYNGGIPGYPNTTVTNGYIDLYVRVYNGTKIIKNIGISSSEFIEL